MASAARWSGWKLIRGLLCAYTAVETGDKGRDAILAKAFRDQPDQWPLPVHPKVWPEVIFAMVTASIVADT